MDSRNNDEVNKITNKNKDTWISFDDILIHRKLFKRGIVAVDTAGTTTRPNVSEKSFGLGKSRQLVFQSLPPELESSRNAHEASVKRVCGLLEELGDTHAYSDWQPYYAKDFASINPSHITGKAVILTKSEKPNVYIAYFIKNGKFITREQDVSASASTDQPLLNGRIPVSANIKQLIFDKAENNKIKDAQKETDKQGSGLCQISNKNLPALSSSIVKKVINASTIMPVDGFIYNPTRKDEVFVAMSLEQSKKGLYVYPWLSQPKKNHSSETRPSISSFSTALCIFGSNLEGIDENDNRQPLIKHDFKFYNEQKIKAIWHNRKTPNPYEVMVFNELEKIANAINIIADPTKPKQLVVHIPYLDYMLFGVQLFIRGRIKLTALDQLFKEVFYKKNEYEQKIRSICQLSKIDVRIESPFENIFNPDHLHHSDSFAVKFLKTLGISSEELNPLSISDTEQAQNEKRLVEHCLNLLQKNNYKSDHQKIWQHFVSANQQMIAQDTKKQTPESITASTDNTSDKRKPTNKLETIEDLFKIANAVMVAVASTDKQPFETCTMQLLSEKQIQASYAEYSNQLSKSTDESTRQAAPPVYNLTIMDSYLVYGPTNQGQAFYSSFCLPTQTRAIREKDILWKAGNNALLFSRRYTNPSQKPIALEEVLPSQNETPLSPKTLSNK